MQNFKIGLKNQEFKRVRISTSHIWFTIIIVFLIRTKKANVQKQIQGATFSLKNREFPKIRHSSTQHSLYDIFSFGCSGPVHQKSTDILPIQMLLVSLN